MAEEVKQTQEQVAPTDIPAGVGNLTNITLEQLPTDGYAKSLAVEFTNKLFGHDFKIVKGSRCRYWVAYPQVEQLFSKEAFIPSVANTGGTSARLDPAGKILVNPDFVFPLWSDANITMFYRTYLTGQYAGQMLTNEPIDKVQAESQLEKDMDYAISNQLLFGSDKTDADGNTRTYEGLAQIIKGALGNYDGSNGYTLSTLNLLDQTNTHKVIVYSPTDATNLNTSVIEALQQMRTAIWNMKNLNTFFTFGTASDGTTRPYNGEGQDIARKYVMVGQNSLIEKLKGFNFTIFKDIASYSGVEDIEQLPITTFDVSHKSDTQMAPVIDVISKLGLSSTQVAIFDAHALEKMEYELPNAHQDFFVNNLTSKLQKNKFFWSNYKINAPVMVYDFLTALDALAIPVQEIKK